MTGLPIGEGLRLTRLLVVPITLEQPALGAAGLDHLECRGRWLRQLRLREVIVRTACRRRGKGRLRGLLALLQPLLQPLLRLLLVMLRRQPSLIAGDLGTHIGIIVCLLLA